MTSLLLFQKSKYNARKLASERLRHYALLLGLKYGKISIRNQSTRWGSCNRKGDLSFNYRIVTLSPELADYIIVHELCHIKEFNHRTGFWKLVSTLIPHYRTLRKELRQHRL